MAITTVDQAIAGMQYPREFAKALTGTLVAGRPHSLWYLAGIPGAGVTPDAGIDGLLLTSGATSAVGQIPFSNPVSGNTYLARLQGMATQSGSLMLCDRIWSNSGYGITGAAFTPISSGALARDVFNGTGGTGIYLGLEVSSTVGAGTPTITATYLDTTGASGTGTNIVNTVASSIAGTFYPISLASGDVGVQQITGMQLSATWTSGSVSLVAYRVIARLELTSANTPNAIDALTAGFPQIHNNTVPFFIFIPSTTTTSNITGQVIWTQG